MLRSEVFRMEEACEHGLKITIPFTLLPVQTPIKSDVSFLGKNLGGLIKRVAGGDREKLQRGKREVH